MDRKCSGLYRHRPKAAPADKSPRRRWPVFVVLPTMGDLGTLKAFAIVILGGLGSFAGATIGGFILAIAEELGAGYISSGYRDAMGFLLIILVLLIKPTGLFARKGSVG